MDEENKKDSGLKNPGFVMLLLLMTLMYGLFAYLSLSDSELFLGGIVYDKLLLIYLVTTLSSGVLINNASKWKGENGKQKVFPMLLAMLMFGLSAGGTIGEMISGHSDSKVSYSEEFDDGNMVYLREVDSKTSLPVSGDMYDVTKIEVYQIHSIFAKRLGAINETYFSVHCIAEERYAIDYDTDSGAMTVACAYGTYGSGFVALKPEYDNGTLAFNFQLDK